jgi:hypothetical protein
MSQLLKSTPMPAPQVAVQPVPEVLAPNMLPLPGMGLGGNGSRPAGSGAGCCLQLEEALSVFSL